MRLMEARTIRAWHYTRMTDGEVDTLHRGGVYPSTVVGRVVANGLVDELHDRGYLVVDGTDGRAHRVQLGEGADLASYPVGAVV